jgi:hypothetical protein
VSFTPNPKFDDYVPGDLFYGLAKPRDAVMKKLGVPFEHERGARINSYR